MKTCRPGLALTTIALILAALAWAAALGSRAAAAQAAAACQGAPVACVLSSSDQLSLAPGQTISRTVPCPEATPALFDSAYTTSNPAVLVTRAPSDGGQGATFTAINRSNALSFVTFHAGCVP